MPERREIGQQTGSKRPAIRTGAAKAAPRSAEAPIKGTADPERSSKSAPAKGGGMRPARSKKPSRKG